jgi:hypothetical protein
MTKPPFFQKNKNFFAPDCEKCDEQKKHAG